MTVPMGSLLPADGVTGSLASPVPFGGLLDEEDRRREGAALATALDPQGDGATVHWENRKTRSKGSITASGRAYPADGKVCRGFVGQLSRETLNRSVQGTACTVAAGQWAVASVPAAAGG
jgi:surface antigen